MNITGYNPFYQHAQDESYSSMRTLSFERVTWQIHPVLNFSILVVCPHNNESNYIMSTF